MRTLAKRDPVRARPGKRARAHHARPPGRSPARAAARPAALAGAGADLAVADALAGPGWIELPGYLSRAESAALGALARARSDAGAFRPAGVGRGRARQIVREIRGDSVLWLASDDPEPAAQRWLARMEALRATLNRELYLGAATFESHLAIYPPGAGYRPHLDRLAGATRRQVSCVLYLNADWRAEDGGELRLYPEAVAPVDVVPRAGTLVAFRSASVRHEVRPALRPRLSVTGWFLTRPLDGSPG